MIGRINEAIAGAPTEPRVLVLDAERVPGIDATVAAPDHPDGVTTSGGLLRRMSA